MFGILALFGDLGCTLGPTLTGLVSEEIKTGLLFSVTFPITVVVCSLAFLIMRKHENAKTLSK